MSVSFTTLTTTLEGAEIPVEEQMDADYLIGLEKAQPGTVTLIHITDV